jgi:hypothetical protein
MIIICIYTTGTIQSLQHSFIYTNIDYNVHGAFPLLYCLPLPIPLTPLSNPLSLGTLLAVTGSVHLGLRLLVN